MSTRYFPDDLIPAHCKKWFFFLLIRLPPRSTLFPTRRSSDLGVLGVAGGLAGRLAVVPLLLDADAVLLQPAAEGVVVHRQHLGRLHPLPLAVGERLLQGPLLQDRKSTRLNSSHMSISYAVFCL